MKRTICLLCAVLTAAGILVSCASENQAGKAELQPDLPAEGVGSTDSEAKNDGGSIDVDLTKMSSTMVYSEVYNMMSLPDNYLGQTVRMQGQFQMYEGDGRNYYVVLIADALACCQQGMEFVLDGDYSYPEDYPEPGTEVTVTGVFDTYMEGEYMRFCQLIDATMTY